MGIHLKRDCSSPDKTGMELAFRTEKTIFAEI